MFRKTVTTAGTQERLTTGDIFCSYVRIQVEDDNTGIMYIGDGQVSSALGIELWAEAQQLDDLQYQQHMELYAIGDDLISLRDIWVDAGTAADGVIVFCMMRA